MEVWSSTVRRSVRAGCGRGQVVIPAPFGFAKRSLPPNDWIWIQAGFGAATASSNAASASESGMTMRLGGSALVHRMAADTSRSG